MEANSLRRAVALAASTALAASVLATTAPAVGADSVDPDEWCLPTLTVRGPSQSLYSQEVYVQAERTCEDTPLQVPALAYLWEIVGVDPSLYDALTVETLRSPTLYVPPRPGYLDIGTDYVARLTVTYGDPFEGQTAQDEATFRYLHSPLVALIAGGSVSAYRGEAITIDASPSYDPDAPGTPLPASAFSWEVRDAGGALLKTYDGVRELELEEPAWMEAGNEYLVEVTVADAASGRSTSFTIGLETLDAVNPAVMISAPTLINRDTRLRLMGAATDLTSTDVAYTWSERTGKLTEADLVNPTIIACRPNTALLIIRENVLEAGETYTFRLTVDDNLSGGKGWAQVDIDVNTPPTGGTVTVAPATGGIALETLFHLEAPGWSDPQTPLYYQFAYKVVGGDIQTTLTQITGNAFADVYLPDGDLKVIAYVYDSMGAWARATTPVTVVSAQQAQTIVFDWNPDKTYGQGPIDLDGKATADSGLEVEYTASGACAINTAGDLRLTAAGECKVTARQPGNDDYLPADPVTVTFTVKKAKLTVTAKDAERIDLMPDPDLDKVTYAGFVNGEDKSVLTGSLSCTTTATKTSPAGTYPIDCSGSSLNAANYWMDWVEGTLTIVYVPPITYEQKQTFTEDMTIRRDDVAVANITVADGILKIEGTAEANVLQTGPGDVIVNGNLGVGLVKGNIVEEGVGDILVFDGAVVEGNLAEHGGGFVRVAGGSRVLGGISEAFDGGVIVQAPGTVVEGTIAESGDGDVVVKNDALVKGKVTEQDEGMVLVTDGGVVEGKISES